MTDGDRLSVPGSIRLPLLAALAVLFTPGGAGAQSASNDATLSALTLSSGLDPAFASTTTSYTSAVKNSTNRVTVTATANDSNATIAYNPATDAHTDAGHQVDLETGENIIVVTVTAADGVTTKEYVIRVWRHPINHSGGNTILRSHGSSDQYGLTLTGNIVMTRLRPGPAPGGTSSTLYACTSAQHRAVPAVGPWISARTRTTPWWGPSTSWASRSLRLKMQPSSMRPAPSSWTRAPRTGCGSASTRAHGN